MATLKKVIKSYDSPHDAVIKMSEGNPGAITVMIEILESDPIMGFLDIICMDERHIRGAKVWCLYKDICKYEVAKMREMIRDKSNDLEKKLENF